LEWSVGVALPKRAASAYTIEVEMEIPSNAFVRHTPWDQLQQFTRLDGNDIVSIDANAVDIDALRRGAVAMANRMARASDGFARHCVFAASLFRYSANENLEEGLSIWLDAAVAMAEEARSKLVVPYPGEALELVRERALVDEFVSVRLLEMLAGAERGLGVLKASRSPHIDRYASAIAAVEARLADALENETNHRAERAFLCPDPLSPTDLEAYLERASRLKKHFQEVLFLHGEVYQVAEKLHHWVAGFVALLASTWAFVWQIALMNRGLSTSSTVGSGIVVVAAVAGIVYATKDRLKELGRTWISGHVHRLYAQRVTRFRAPARRFPGREVIVAARESFDQKVEHLPDPLNPESGATVPRTTLRYSQKGSIAALPQITASGVRRIKHVFRYDLSPLFPRLDDAVKSVPVLDRATRRMCLTAAPRCYRIPLSLRVRSGGETWEERVTVVLHKGGLDRIERSVAPSDSDPLLDC
jgi:hypothetical protein